MLWIGKNPNNLKNFIKNSRRRAALNKIRDSFTTNSIKNRKNQLNCAFHIPDCWSVVGLCSSNASNSTVSFFLYRNNYVAYIISPINYYSTTYDSNSRTITVSSTFASSSLLLFQRYFTLVFNVLNVPTILKLKFRGKGYYIYKNRRNTITPQFNYAHRIYIYSPFVHMKFLTKTSIIIFGFTKTDLKIAGLNIFQRRPINIFTGRGVRFTKQVIYKKTGKVSSYR